MVHRTFAYRCIALLILCVWLFGSPGIFAQYDSDDGVTLLMSSVRDADLKIFRIALKSTSNINAQDAYGWTALTYAVARGDKDMTKKLLAKGADANIVDEDGRSIMMHAVDYNREAIVKSLIEYKADLDRRDKKGATAMGLAWTRANDKIVALLKNAGAAEIKAEDKRTNIYTPLPPYSGPLLLNARESSGNLLPFAPTGTHELKMRVLVGVDGTARKVRVLIGLPNGGTVAAVQDAYRARYQPATMNGRPIEAWMDRGAIIRKTMPVQSPFNW
jgi:hypothetical protein